MNFRYQLFHSYAQKLVRDIRRHIARHPYLVALGVIIAYLALLQHSFFFGGDAWAESYAEYLNESVRLGWQEVFAQSWAGYLTVLPSAVAKLYVALGGPLGYIDYFFRAITIIFTMFSASLVATKTFRTLIASDLLRILLALGIVMILTDVATFSFINVWYVGLIPIILLYLSPEKISRKADIFFGIFGALIALTKPFLLLLPIAGYRIMRSRQWLGPVILLVGALIQSAQILFNDDRGIIEGAAFNLKQIIGGIFTGSGVEFLKLLNIHPSSFVYVVIANIILLVIFILLWKLKNPSTAIFLAILYAFSIYTYLLAPDAVLYTGLMSYEDIFLSSSKTQREVIINSTLLVSLFILIGAMWANKKKRLLRLSKKQRQIGLIVFSLLLLFAIYKPIDTSSAGVSNSAVEPFRHRLNQNLPTCIPLAPTPVFYNYADWYFEYQTKCSTPHHKPNFFNPDFKNSVGVANNTVLHVDAALFGLNNTDLGALVIPIRNTSGKDQRVSITDTASRMRFERTVSADREVQFVTFNTIGLPQQTEYNFALTGYSLELFEDSRSHAPVLYGYFLEY